MSKPFKPPSGKALVTVETAEGVEYEAKCIVIEGVVSPGSQGGGGGKKGGGYDVHFFSFACWRRPGLPLVERELTLLRAVPPFADRQDEDESVFDQFLEYSFQRLRVLMCTDQTRAIVDKVMKFDEPDEALQAYVTHLRTPVTLTTKRFGELVLNRKYDWFEAKAKWNRKRIELTFKTRNDGTIDIALGIAEQLWINEALWKRKIDDFAVQELLTLKNEDWLDDKEAALTPKQFKARMTLQSISFDEDGEFEFWHEDGDLFFGHSIQICGNLKDGLTNADIPG